MRACVRACVRVSLFFSFFFLCVCVSMCIGSSCNLDMFGIVSILNIVGRVSITGAASILIIVSSV